MKIASILCLSALLVSVNDNGYTLRGDQIEFIYPSHESALDVYVSGNFNGWAKSDPQWKMSFDPVRSAYVLTLPISSFKTSSRSFYEFTFRVNERLIDANPKAEGVIHCAGYGYRYVIRWS